MSTPAVVFRRQQADASKVFEKHGSMYFVRIYYFSLSLPHSLCGYLGQILPVPVEDVRWPWPFNQEAEISRPC